LAIAVAIAIGHHRHHDVGHFQELLPLERQELYLINRSKECLPYFILLGQWAAY
jgi:hypothetical protein